jgi:hypothetical protein
MTNREVIAKAHSDPAFRKDLLKELMRIAIAEDPHLLTKALLKLEEKYK